MFGVRSHEGLSLRQVKVKDVVGEGDHRDLVLHVVHVKSLAVAPHHGVVLAAFLPVQLPAVFAAEEVCRLQHLDLLLAWCSRFTTVVLVLLCSGTVLLAFALLFFELDRLQLLPHLFASLDVFKLLFDIFLRVACRHRQRIIVW